MYIYCISKRPFHIFQLNPFVRVTVDDTAQECPDRLGGRQSKEKLTFTAKLKILTEAIIPSCSWFKVVL